MGLFERWTAADSTKIRIHPFASALREWTRGAVTKTQVVNAFSLSSEDQIELDAIKTKYDGLNTNQKAEFVVKLHDVMILSEAGLYDKAKAKTELGF